MRAGSRVHPLHDLHRAERSETARRFAALCACVVALGCAEDGPASPGGCGPFGYRCRINNPSVWWHNTIFTPRIRTGSPLDTCHTETIRCHYIFTQAMGLQRDLVDCHAAFLRNDPGIHFRLRFRAPFHELPIGRVLQLGTDFRLEQLYEIGIDPETARPAIRFDARAPIVGTLTLTVLGPPRHIGVNVPASLPYVRVEGQLCGEPLNVIFRGETVEIAFI